MRNLIDFVTNPARKAAVLDGTGAYCDGELAEAMQEGPGVIGWPKGRVNLADEVNVEARIQFVGEDSGLFGIPVSEVRFDADTAGFIFHRQLTGPNSPLSVLPDGAGIEGLYVRSDGGTVGDGVRMWAASDVRRCVVNGFGEKGVKIAAEHTNQNSNANGWSLDQVYIRACGGDGVFVDGADANTGQTDNVKVENCDGWAFNDSSFLGNLHSNPTAHACGLGAFHEDNVNARNLWLMAYSEGGQPPSKFLSPKSLVLGGLHGAGIHPDSLATILVDGIMNRMYFEASGISNTGTQSETKIRFNNDWPSLVDWIIDGDDSRGWNVPYLDERKQVFQIRYKRKESNAVVTLTTDKNATSEKPLLIDQSANAIPGGEIILNKGFWIPVGLGKYKKITPEMLQTIFGNM